MKRYVCNRYFGPILGLALLFMSSEARAWSAYKLGGHPSLIAITAKSVNNDVAFAKIFEDPAEFSHLVNLLTDMDPNNDVEIIGNEIGSLEAAASGFCSELEENSLRIRSWKDQDGVDIGTSLISGAKVYPKNNGYKVSRIIVDCKQPESQRLALAVRSSLPYLISCIEFSGQKILNRYFRNKEEDLSEFASPDSRIQERQEIDAESLAMRIHLFKGLSRLKRQALEWFKSNSFAQFQSGMRASRKVSLDQAFESLKSLEWDSEITRLSENYQKQAELYPDVYPLSKIRSSRSQAILARLRKSSSVRQPASQK